MQAPKCGSKQWNQKSKKTFSVRLCGKLKPVLHGNEAVLCPKDLPLLEGKALLRNPVFSSFLNVDSHKDASGDRNHKNCELLP